MSQKKKTAQKEATHYPLLQIPWVVVKQVQQKGPGLALAFALLAIVLFLVNQPSNKQGDSPAVQAQPVLAIKIPATLGADTAAELPAVNFGIPGGNLISAEAQLARIDPTITYVPRLFANEPFPVASEGLQKLTSQFLNAFATGDKEGMWKYGSLLAYASQEPSPVQSDAQAVLTGLIIGFDSSARSDLTVDSNEWVYNTTLALYTLTTPAEQQAKNTADQLVNDYAYATNPDNQFQPTGVPATSIPQPAETNPGEIASEVITQDAIDQLTKGTLAAPVDSKGYGIIFSTVNLIHGLRHAWELPNGYVLSTHTAQLSDLLPVPEIFATTQAHFVFLSESENANPTDACSKASFQQALPVWHGTDCSGLYWWVEIVLLRGSLSLQVGQLVETQSLAKQTLDILSP